MRKLPGNPHDVNANVRRAFARVAAQVASRQRAERPEPVEYSCPICRNRSVDGKIIHESHCLRFGALERALRSEGGLR